MGEVPKRKRVEAEEETSKEDATLTPNVDIKRKVIVVLEEASLDVIKSNRGSYEILNCDDHLSLHQKLKKTPSESRPDILHQCLLTILDSPLNKCGHILKLLVRTSTNVIFEINPETRIPRTFKRFAGLMVQLLHKYKIKSSESNTTLLRVVKGPINNHFPVNSLVFSTCMDGTLVDIQHFVEEIEDSRPYVFVFGAIAKGVISPTYADSTLSFSKYPLSAACAVSRLMTAFERKWKIL